MNISFILEKALNLHPEKESILCGDVRLTYRSFAGRVFALARFLRSLGLTEGDRIAILHNNGHEYLETYFAAAWSGMVLTPLNFRLSPRETAFILQDAGARILIAAPRFREPVSVLHELNVPLERVLWTGGGKIGCPYPSAVYEDIVRSGPSSPPAPATSKDDDIAHLYYTSGTTGLPKGVMLSHKNVCSHALCAIAELGLRDTDRWIHVAPMFHLADAWAAFAVTWVGGCHVVVPEFDTREVLSAMERDRVTITNMVPTMLNLLVNDPAVGSYELTTLRAIMSGGAPIAPELVRKIMDTFKCDYIQTYGMTETSPYLTLSLLKKHLLDLPDHERFVFKAKTGRPFIGVLLKVVREDGSEVVPDDFEVGEILVQGDTVTPGYWNRSEETAKTFQGEWLRTGDLATVDAEGYVNIVDRKKDMIITGGENVYSVEVENVLYTHPSVLEAAVVGVSDPRWGERVSAAVVLKPGMNACERELMEHCRKRIAHYKVPKSILFADALPKTGSGKIYKKGIREMLLSGVPED